MRSHLDICDASANLKLRHCPSLRGATRRSNPAFSAAWIASRSLPPNLIRWPAMTARKSGWAKRSVPTCSIDMRMKAWARRVAPLPALRLLSPPHACRICLIWDHSRRRKCGTTTLCPLAAESRCRIWRRNRPCIEAPASVGFQSHRAFWFGSLRCSASLSQLRGHAQLRQKAAQSKFPRPLG